MKKLILAFSILALTSIWTPAATQVFGSLITVDTTTSNSVAVATTTVYFPVGIFIVSNGGTVNTNALTGVKQFSLDGTNWFTIGATYRPSSTNAGTDTIAATVVPIPIQMRMSATTTNSVTVGAVYLP